MAAKSNGEPFVDTINFGTHYCAMYRWDTSDPWTILADKTKCRMIFPSSSVARSEAIRILTARRRIRAERCGDHPEPVDPLASEVDDFLRNRSARAEAERRAVFDTSPATIGFAEKGRTFEIERKKRRRA